MAHYGSLLMDVPGTGITRCVDAIQLDGWLDSSMVRPWPAAAPEPLQTMAALVCVCGRRGPTIANYGCLGIHLWSTRAFRSSKTLLAKGVSLLSTSDGRKAINVVGFWVSGFRVLPRVVGEPLSVGTKRCSMRS